MTKGIRAYVGRTSPQEIGTFDKLVKENADAGTVEATPIRRISGRITLSIQVRFQRQTDNGLPFSA